MNDMKDVDLEIRDIQQQLLDYLRRHWQLFLAEGLFFIVLGLCAVAVSHFFTVAIVVFLGWLMLFGGLVHVGRTLVFSMMPGF
jgi:uncharacterized membrane protein HdeD (DUF308 family)